MMAINYLLKRSLILVFPAFTYLCTSAILGVFTTNGPQKYSSASPVPLVHELFESINLWRHKREFNYIIKSASSFRLKLPGKVLDLGNDIQLGHLQKNNQQV